MVDEGTRTRLGITAVIVGTAVFTAGIFAAHFTGLPEQNNLGVDIYPDIPRGWQWVIGSEIVALVGSQVIIAGIALAWLYERPMTWARATVGAMLVTLEMLILFGIVPNEWLNLTQGTFEWTSQKIAFEIPSFLVLNNEVSVSFGAIKDAVSGGYSAGLLGLVIVVTYQYQVRSQRARTETKPQPVSVYGRPVVKGEQ